ncbi:MAG: hypothetical protein RQ736_15025 [Thiogranum sp.]|nr:hypothetical protein [Thiogranum sp.]
MMEYRNTQSSSGLDSQTAQTENFANTININEVIRLRFLQQTAEYLRAGRENTPAWLDEKMKS